MSEDLKKIALSDKLDVFIKYKDEPLINIKAFSDFIEKLYKDEYVDKAKRWCDDMIKSNQYGLAEMLQNLKNNAENEDDFTRYFWSYYAKAQQNDAETEKYINIYIDCFVLKENILLIKEMYNVLETIEIFVTLSETYVALIKNIDSKIIEKRIVDVSYYIYILISLFLILVFLGIIKMKK